MNWINSAVATWASPKYDEASCRDRGTWHTLLFYCAFVENSGRVLGCKSWSRRKCRAVLKVSREDILRTSFYWHWESDDLVVRDYPVDQEQKAQYQRAYAQYMNMVRWRKNKGLPVDDLRPPVPLEKAPSADPHGNPARTPDGKTEVPPARTPEGTPGGTPQGNLVQVTDEDERRGANYPPNFPCGFEEAIKRSSGLDPNLVRREWLSAAARGGRDWQMRDICDWNSYIQMQKDFRARKPAPPKRPVVKPPVPAEAASGKAALHSWRRLEVLEKELTKVNEKLGRFTRPNAEVFPEKHQQIENLKAPLRARRDELERMISDLNQTKPSVENQQTWTCPTSFRRKVLSILAAPNMDQVCHKTHRVTL